MATIRDVAKLAGVSPASVSRILNRDPTYKATEETVGKVLRTAKELDYHVPPAYRQRKSSAKIGCISRMTEEKTKDSYYTSIVDSIQEFCDRKEIELNLVQSQFDINNPDILKNFLSTKMDGVIVMGELNVRVIDLILQKGIHVVGIDTTSDKIDNVRYNRYQAGCIAMEYLIKNGHRDIAYIGSHVPSASISDIGRYEAYGKMLSSIGATPDPDWIIDCKWQRAVCYEKTKQLIALSHRPTAIFVASDHMAMAAMSAIAECGLKIPDDISIIGITDIETSKYLTPPLTTVKIPQKEIGKIAASTLFARITGDDTVAKQIFVPTTLVVRKSVRPIANLSDAHAGKELL